MYTVGMYVCIYDVIATCYMYIVIVCLYVCMHVCVRVVYVYIVRVYVHNLINIIIVIFITHTCSKILTVHVLMRKEERSKQGQTNNKAKQHSTPKACSHFSYMYMHVHAIILSCVYGQRHILCFWP